MRQIATIEQASFNDPWLDHDFRSHLRQASVLCYVVEHNGFLVAYAIIKYFSDHIELCSLAVDDHYRRQKIATLIIEMLKIKLQLEQKDYVEAYVSEYNLDAQLFLRNNGFLAKDVIRDCYAQGHGCYYMVFDPTGQI